jgi:hypothetical protein
MSPVKALRHESCCHRCVLKRWSTKAVTSSLVADQECRDAQDAKRDIQVAVSPPPVTTAYSAAAALRPCRFATPSHARCGLRSTPANGWTRVGCACLCPPLARNLSAPSHYDHTPPPTPSDYASPPTFTSRPCGKTSPTTAATLTSTRSLSRRSARCQAGGPFSSTTFPSGSVT